MLNFNTNLVSYSTKLHDKKTISQCRIKMSMESRKSLQSFTIASQKTFKIKQNPT